MPNVRQPHDLLPAPSGRRPRVPPTLASLLDQAPLDIVCIGSPSGMHADEIASGRLGRVLLVDARVKWYRAPEYYRNAAWRGTPSLHGGGARMNQGIHTIDLLLYMLGVLKEVQARTATTLRAIDVEDTPVASLVFASGAPGTFQATTAAWPGYPRRVEISGSEGRRSVALAAALCESARTGGTIAVETAVAARG